MTWAHTHTKTTATNRTGPAANRTQTRSLQNCATDRPAAAAVVDIVSLATSIGAHARRGGGGGGG